MKIELILASLMVLTSAQYFDQVAMESGARDNIAMESGSRDNIALESGNPTAEQIQTPQQYVTYAAPQLAQQQIVYQQQPQQQIVYQQPAQQQQLVYQQPAQQQQLVYQQPAQQQQIVYQQQPQQQIVYEQQPQQVFVPQAYAASGGNSELLYAKSLANSGGRDDSVIQSVFDFMKSQMHTVPMQTYIAPPAQILTQQNYISESPAQTVVNFPVQAQAQYTKYVAPLVQTYATAAPVVQSANQIVKLTQGYVSQTPVANNVAQTYSAPTVLNNQPVTILKKVKIPKAKEQKAKSKEILFAPVKGHYLPTLVFTTKTRNGFFNDAPPANKPSEGYGAPAQENKPQSGYGAPAEENRPQSGYGAPAQENKPQAEYGPPAQENRPQSGYGAPAQENRSQSGYGAPAQENRPQSGYGAPAQENRPQSGYGAPAQENRPQSGYGAPAQENRPQSGYGAPAQENRPQSGYGAPAQENKPQSGYGAPAQENKPQSGYGAPAQENQPQSGYGAPAPENRPQSGYGPPAPENRPQSGYGPPAQENKPQTEYGPPANENGPSGGYDTPTVVQTVAASNLKASYGPPGYTPPAVLESYTPVAKLTDTLYGSPEPQPQQPQNDVYRITQSLISEQPLESYGPPQEIRQVYGIPNQPQDHKHIYVHTAPPEIGSPTVRILQPVSQNPEKHYQIIFVKAPSPSIPQRTEIQLPPNPIQKTLVYVLTKSPESNHEIKISKPAPTAPSKPEVYFIRYAANAPDLSSQYGAPIAPGPVLVSRQPTPIISYAAPSSLDVYAPEMKHSSYSTNYHKREIVAAIEEENKKSVNNIESVISTSDTTDSGEPVI